MLLLPFNARVSVTHESKHDASDLYFWCQLAKLNFGDSKKGNRRHDMNEVKLVKGLDWLVGAIGNAQWTGKTYVCHFLLVVCSGTLI